jgi:hypothetical protein
MNGWAIFNGSIGRRDGVQQVIKIPTVGADVPDMAGHECGPSSVKPLLTFLSTNKRLPSSTIHTLYPPDPLRQVFY